MLTYMAYFLIEFSREVPDNNLESQEACKNRGSGLPLIERDHGMSSSTETLNGGD